MSHIFISYSKKNKDYARAFADHLEVNGFDVWIDDEIDYGDAWEHKMFKAINDSAAFVVIMTPGAYESRWVINECNHAETRDMNLCCGIALVVDRMNSRGVSKHVVFHVLDDGILVPTVPAQGQRDVPVMYGVHRWHSTIVSRLQAGEPEK